MKPGTFRRVALILLALLLISMVLFATLAIASHGHCCITDCTICLYLAKLQTTLRQATLSFGAETEALFGAALLILAVCALQTKPPPQTLVTWKARMNN